MMKLFLETLYLNFVGLRLSFVGFKWTQTKFTQKCDTS